LLRNARTSWRSQLRNPGLEELLKPETNQADRFASGIFPRVEKRLKE
jgi:hypothetical protein